MGQKIGKITHYFGKLGVAIVKLENPLSKGDEIQFKGHTTDFTQKAEELQLDHAPIEKGEVGQEIGLKVEKNVRDGDEVSLAE